MTAAANTRMSAEPNLTPMIDVLLVLVIVFMVMTIQVHRTMDALLPEACAGICESTAQIVLEVRPGPSYRINQHVVAAQDLASQLRDLYGARPEKIIQVAGYPGVRYDEVMSAMDIAKSAGVRVLSIAPQELYLRR